MANPLEEYKKRFEVQASPQGPVFPPMPGYETRQQKAQAEVENIDSMIEDRTVSNQIAAQNAAVNTQDFNLRATKEQREAEEKARLLTVGKTARELDQDEMLRAIQKARKMVSPYSTGWGHTLLQVIPTTEARSLQGLVDNNIGGKIWIDKIGEMRAKAAEYGGTGTGAGQFTEKEGERAVNSITNLDLGRTPQEVLQSLDELEFHYKWMKARAEGLDPNDPAVQKRFGIPRLDAAVDPTDPKKLLSGNEKAIEVPEEMQREYAQRLLRIPRGELTRDEYVGLVTDVYQKYGMDPNIGPWTDDFVKTYNSKAAGQKINLRIPGTDAKATWMEGNLSRAVQTPVGATGAKFVNAMGLGLPELLQGQKGRDAMEAIGDIQPEASFLGDALGSMLAVGGAGRGAKAAGLLVDRPVARDMMTDMTYSALREFNQSERGEGISGALGGAAEAGAFNLGTRGLLRGAGDIANPQTREILDRYRQETPQVYGSLTTPQKIGMGESEAEFSRFPGVEGGRAKAAQAVSQQFSEGVYRSLDLPPKGLKGAALIKDLKAEVDNAFEQIAPQPVGKIGNAGVNNIMSVINDPVLISTTHGRKLRARIIRDLSGLRVNGKFSATKNPTAGELRAVTSKLGTTYADLIDKVDGEFGDVSRAAALKAAELRRGLIDGIADPNIKTRFSKVSEASARLQIITDASKRAGAGVEHIPTPEQLLASVSRNDPTASGSAIATSEARFQKELEDMVRVLGPSTSTGASNRLPNLSFLGVGLGTGMAATNIPGIAAALAGRRGGFADLPSDLTIPPMSQVLQSYITRKKQEEGLN